MTDKTLTAHMESLESRLMYLEAAVEELTRTVLEQGKIIQRQSTAIELLEKQLRAATAATIATASEETPPPHY